MSRVLLLQLDGKLPNIPLTDWIAADYRPEKLQKVFV